MAKFIKKRTYNFSFFYIDEEWNMNEHEMRLSIFRNKDSGDDLGAATDQDSYLVLFRSIDKLQLRMIRNEFISFLNSHPIVNMIEFGDKWIEMFAHENNLNGGYFGMSGKKEPNSYHQMYLYKLDKK